MSAPLTDAAAGRPLVLVIGATGYLGRHIVARLRQSGYRVRALARDPNRLGFTRDSGIEVFVGQVTRPETLAGLCDGVSVVISTLGVRSLKRKPTPWEVDYQGNLTVLQMARHAQVERFLFVGVLRGERLRASVPVVEPRERFIDALRQSAIPWTVLRPTGFFNDMETIFNQARRGRVTLLGSGEARMNPIHPTDLASEIIRCLGDEAARDMSVDVGGPDIYSYAEIARLAFRALGKPAHITRIPPGLVDGISQAVKPFNPTAAGFLRFIRAVMTTDMTAPPTGNVHLSDSFARLAASHREALSPEVSTPAPDSRP